MSPSAPTTGGALAAASNEEVHSTAPVASATLVTRASAPASTTAPPETAGASSTPLPVANSQSGAPPPADARAYAVPSAADTKTAVAPSGDRLTGDVGTADTFFGKALHSAAPVATDSARTLPLYSDIKSAAPSAESVSGDGAWPSSVTLHSATPPALALSALMLGALATLLATKSTPPPPPPDAGASASHAAVPAAGPVSVARHASVCVSVRTA